MINKFINKLRALRQRTGILSIPQQTKTAAFQNTDSLFLGYGELAKKQGFDKLYVAISFDCDTPEDIPASEKVFEWLYQRHIQATFAVPGQQLIQGADTYRKIFDKGADFINHGGRPHAEWRDGRYWSITFYNEMSSDEVLKDIQTGHEIFCKTLRASPMGFRAPHFGYFQAKDQRELMYSLLRELGYTYSSSTLPEYGLHNGPVVNENNFFELPLSGSVSNPFTILDSWNYIISPYEPVLQDQYANLFIETVNKFLEIGIPGVLNYYVDPAHVVNSSAFFNALDHLLKHNIETINFSQMLEIAKKQ